MRLDKKTTILLLLGCCIPGIGAADLTLSLEQRLRYETIHNHFHPARSNSDDLALSRTLLYGEYAHDNWKVVLEGMDARQLQSDRATGLNAGMVNTAELIQAYVGFENESWSVDIGKMTREERTRRVVARNRFRNTTNHFVGIDIKRKLAEDQLRFFLLSPNETRPDRLADFHDNRQADDTFHGDNRVAGLTWQTENSFADMELGLFAWNRSDVRDQEQDLRALSLHFKKELENGWRLDNHSVYQWGDKNGSHRAWMQHIKASVGEERTVSFALDLASGDKYGVDNFDTWLGVQRFEWGPGSLYNAFRRSNVVSPVVRIDWQTPNWRNYVALRAVWLMDGKGGWVGVTQPDVRNSKKYLGTQLDLSLRRQLAKGVTLGVGGAYLKKGGLSQEVGATSRDTRYAYAELTIRLSCDRGC